MPLGDAREGTVPRKQKGGKKWSAEVTMEAVQGDVRAPKLDVEDAEADEAEDGQDKIVVLLAHTFHQAEGSYRAAVA